jgi:Domain of unknown function (DUF4838)
MRTKTRIGGITASVLTVVLMILAFASISFGDVVISKKGKAAARIVLAADACETEKWAADELAFFLHLATGCSIPVADDFAPTENRLLVGEKAAGLAEPGFDAKTLAPEEIIVETHGHDLILAGGSPRGTLYAVYTFLEDVVGCRWWTQATWNIPRKPSLSIGPVSIRYAPPLEYREPFWFVAFDPLWAARNKVNGTRAGGDDRRGGRHVYEGFVHTFYSLVPPERYFNAHPEWFSEIDGQRTFKDAQLCLTNEEMRLELVKNLKTKLRDNPAATIASVSQNDCLNPCQCARCRAVDEEEGSPSGALVRFVNAVAADVEAEFSRITIDTLAYQYTRRPPRITRPRPNVIIRLCSIECSFSRPLDDPGNKDFLDDLEGWSRIADRLFVWDYTTDFSHYIQPHPNYSVLGPNIRLFIRNNVRGIFEQGAYQSWGSEMAEMRAWILAKLLWNPALDEGTLRREFLSGYYGPAAGDIEEYLALLENAVQETGDHLGCFSPPDARFLSLGTMLKAWEILKRADARIGRDAELRKRWRRVRMPVVYVVLTRWEEFEKEARERGREWPWPRTRQELLDGFLADARSEGVTMISEWQTLADWAARGGNVH